MLTACNSIVIDHLLIEDINVSSVMSDSNEYKIMIDVSQANDCYYYRYRFRFDFFSSKTPLFLGTSV